MESNDILLTSALISLVVGCYLFIENFKLKRENFNLKLELFHTLSTVIQLSDDLIRINEEYLEKNKEPQNDGYKNEN